MRTYYPGVFSQLIGRYFPALCQSRFIRIQNDAAVSVFRHDMFLLFKVKL